MRQIDTIFYNFVIIIVLFVETPRKFITANILLLFIYLFFIIYLRGVSTNKTIIYFIAMQTYKELNFVIIHFFAVAIAST
jgi:hypothetical protein